MPRTLGLAFGFVGAMSVFAAFSTLAQANEDNSISTRVSVKGVNFENPQEARAFHDRLLNAAHRVCDVASGSLEAREENAVCRARAMDEAVAELSRPGLTRRHAEASRDDNAQMAAIRGGEGW